MSVKKLKSTKCFSKASLNGDVNENNEANQRFVYHSFHNQGSRNANIYLNKVLRAEYEHYSVKQLELLVYFGVH